MKNKYKNKAIWTLVKGFIKKSKKNFRFSVISITIGVWGLITITSVINGFDNVLISSITNFYPHIIIAGNYNEENIEVKNKFNFNQSTSMISSGANFEFIEIFELSNNYNNDNLNISGDFSELIIGDELAKNLNVKIGDKVNYYIVSGIFPIVKTKKISGIFKTGVFQFDSKLCMIKNSEGMFRYSGLYLNSPKRADKFKEKYLQEYSSITWVNANSTLTKTVEIDSLFAILITFFVVLMSGFSISNSVTYSVYNRKKEIGTLYSLGFSKKNISKIFISESIIISFLGYISGLIISLFTLGIIDLLKIKLPTGIFYIDYLPVKINFDILLLSFVINTTIVFVFSYISTKKILKMDILEAIKNDE